MDNTRQHPRYRCHGGVEIHVPNTPKRLWGHLGDISRNGCYLHGAEPWDVGTEVEIHIDSGSANIFGRGMVATCHPGVGLGICFVEIYPEYRDEFEALLSNLERRASGNTKVHTLPFPITAE